MSGVTVGFDPIPQASAPSASESFESMEEAAQTSDRSVTIKGVTACTKPFFEIIVRDPDGKPIEGAICKLVFLDSREKATDANGLARFDDVSTDVETLDVRIYDDAATDPPTRRVDVEAKQEAKASEVSEAEPEGTPIYYANVELD